MVSRLKRILVPKATTRHHLSSRIFSNLPMLHFKPPGDSGDKTIPPNQTRPPAGTEKKKMPPRLQLTPQIRAALAPVPMRPATPSLATLFTRLSLQNIPAATTIAGARRGAHILATLSNNPGATRNKQRVGRGPSSGYGKTSGRGQKGRKARAKVNAWFQGGQTPLIRIKGKKGFDNQ